MRKSEEKGVGLTREAETSRLECRKAQRQLAQSQQRCERLAKELNEKERGLITAGANNR